jgi:hypothetical protein
MNCVYGGVEYSEGSLICSNGRELVCDGGQWRENGYTCDDASKNEVPGPRICATSAAVQCLQFVPNGDGIYPVIVNKCQDCMDGMLVIDGNVQWVRVPGYGTAKLPTHNYRRIDLVAEKKCN